MVRLTRLPSCSSCQPLRRAASTRSAIISIAVSRSRSSHSVPYGRRYLTFVTRVGLVTSDLLALPLGQSRPRLIGESGSPSIWTTFSSFTNTFWPQPTAQYGHTLWTTRSAVAVRATTLSVALLRAALPRPSGSEPVSCRYTGHASSHVFTLGTLPPGMSSGMASTRPMNDAARFTTRVTKEGPLDSRPPVATTGSPPSLSDPSPRIRQALRRGRGATSQSPVQPHDLWSAARIIGTPRRVRTGRYLFRETRRH